MCLNDPMWWQLNSVFQEYFSESAGENEDGEHELDYKVRFCFYVCFSINDLFLELWAVLIMSWFVHRRNRWRPKSTSCSEEHPRIPSWQTGNTWTDIYLKNRRCVDADGQLRFHPSKRTYSSSYHLLLGVWKLTNAWCLTLKPCRDDFVLIPQQDGDFGKKSASKKNSIRRWSEVTYNESTAFDQIIFFFFLQFH